MFTEKSQTHKEPLPVFQPGAVLSFDSRGMDRMEGTLARVLYPSRAAGPRIFQFPGFRLSIRRLPFEPLKTSLILSTTS